MAANQCKSGLKLGWLIGQTGASGTLGMNTDTAQAASFFTEQAKTLIEVSLFCVTKTGTLASGDLTISIYAAGSTGHPTGSSLASSSTLSSPAANNTWLRFTGLSLSLTANTMYWAVITSSNGTPSSNYVTLANDYTTISDDFGSGGNGYLGDWSTNGGSTWSSPLTVFAPIRLGFSDSTYDGIPLQPYTNVIATGNLEYGTKFTSPANVTLNVVGISFLIDPISGFTGNPRLRLYTGSTPTLIATATFQGVGLALGLKWMSFFFGASYSIAPGTIVRVTLGDDTAGDTHGFLTRQWAWDGDANSASLLPFQGTLAATHYDGTTWSDTAAAGSPFALLLNSTGEFTSSGGGAPQIGSPLIRSSKRVVA